MERYSGNPLALKLVAQTVQELFGSQIGDFLAVEAPIFDDIGAVLDQQHARLSVLEQEILCWLAIRREPTTAVELRADLLSRARRASLSRRCAAYSGVGCWSRHLARRSPYRM